MSDEQPKKRGRPRKKLKDNAPALSAENIKISVQSDEDLFKVQALIRDALKDVVYEEKKHRIDKNKAIDAMVGTCSEFMKSFIIMGYDMDNSAIRPIFYAKSDLEADALSHYMQQYFINSMKDMRE